MNGHPGDVFQRDPRNLLDIRNSLCILARIQDREFQSQFQMNNQPPYGRLPELVRHHPQGVERKSALRPSFTDAGSLASAAGGPPGLRRAL